MTNKPLLERELIKQLCEAFDAKEHHLCHFGSLGQHTPEQFARILSNTVRIKVVRELKERIDDYRKSNELWRKDKDTILSDFEEWIDEVFGK